MRSILARSLRARQGLQRIADDASAPRAISGPVVGFPADGWAVVLLGWMHMLD